jgi:hypothetical protein
MSEFWIIKIILSQIRPFSLGSFTRCNACCCFQACSISTRISDEVHRFDLLVGGLIGVVIGVELGSATTAELKSNDESRCTI